MSQIKSDQNGPGGYRQIVESSNIRIFDEYMKSKASRLPSLANVEQLTPSVLRILGQNPGKFTLQGTNTYIVGTGRDRILIDASDGAPAWAELVALTLETQNIALSCVLLTHWHGDHVGGVPHLLRLFPHLQKSIYKHQPEAGQTNIAQGQEFRVKGATIRALHAPGHAEDHMCFILEEEQAMFTGDNILGHGASVVEDLGTFMVSLREMQKQKCTIGYPAHGAKISDLQAVIEAELSLKLRREDQIMDALGRVRVRGERSITVPTLVTEIYGEAMDDHIRTFVLEPRTAEMLQKLAIDNKVAFRMQSGLKQWFSLAAGQ